MELHCDRLWKYAWKPHCTFLCIFIVATMSNNLLKINKHAGLLKSVGSGAALSIVIHRSGG